ncbi:MAG: cytochrome c3 family protein [Candidatus Marinimicrobia bacterium]|nr:cytochrome c3 family protein [Candidatus Neomarinimicrobiota bacterium]MCF7839638.1 cytochrome c3 family protein [Candidatus Neomarinimicrobiota bacterium]MCF7902538.1 cytochrome c3 family protein [Candidatus Neomarinimicrobiota bacterium]
MRTNEIVRLPVRPGFLLQILFFTFLTSGLISPGSLWAQTGDNEDCLTCHGYRTLEQDVNGKSVSLFVDRQIFNRSVHNVLNCVDCHEDAIMGETGHSPDLEKVSCGNCHRVALQQYSMSLHDKRVAGGEELAPSCQTCHGSHNIKPIASPESNVSPIKIPGLCGSCHHEGTEVSERYAIPQDKILENYSQSMHGEGLLKKGLTVSANCVSCHTAHRILPHTDSRSTIAKQNIAATCSNCHTEIERVHQKVIRGQLWETEPHKLPACVDCHQPHKVRKSLYIEGIADEDCQKCHADPEIKSALDGHSLFVDKIEISHSRHAKTACSQCHINVDPRHDRPCETLTEKVDCSICHEAQGEDFRHSIHGELIVKNDPNGPTCTECHGDHSVQGRANPESPIFPTNIPNLCGNCHRTGHEAAERYEGTEKDIVFNYIESIHGKGLLKSGLTVTATCTNCHTAHREQPVSNPNSSVHPTNIADTCGKCHMGVEATFLKSIHSPLVSQTDERLPVCSTCHSAHTISRTDQEGFKLQMMTQCGQCHKAVTESYFDTYHGKVSQLGYTKTAKCYDCHGAHDILPPEDANSRLSRQNVVETCKSCHPAANRQFAGYLTHATHHDPVKYPILFWTFWAMTGLLTVTFVVAGLHTLLWLPRSFQWKRELRRRLAAAEHAEQSDENIDEENHEQS